jgi:glycosyltransferase involved in cell wall biosynthesis
MSCEKPFVATNCTTTPEFSGNGKRGLGAKVKISQVDRTVVRPWVDIEDFCDKVEYLLDHDNIREKMGKAGRRWVRRNCDYPIITQKWTNLFESLNTNRVVIKKVVKN